jgi:hypothetical protein
MAEIKNYTLNFCCGRLLRSLNFAGAKLAFAEVERAPRRTHKVANG